MPVSPLSATPYIAAPEHGWVRQWLADLPMQVKSGAAWLSLSLPLPHLDLLAALTALSPFCQNPQPWHFYLEHPSTSQAVLGLDPLHQFQAQGESRFSQIKAFCQTTLADIAIYEPDGAVLAPNLWTETAPGLGQPCIFCSFSFFEQGMAISPAPSREQSGFPVAWAVLPRWQLRQSQNTTTLTLTSHRPTTDQAWQELTAELLGAWYELQQPLTLITGEPLALNLPNVAPQAATFQTQINHALEEIATGTLEKLVLACAVDIEVARDFQPLVTVDHLRRTYPSCYSFSLSNGLGQTFIGASPERLVTLKAGQLVVDALAGSAPRHEQPELDQHLGQGLSQSRKDLREHQVIVDFLSQALTEFSEEIAYPQQPTLYRLANIQHLQTLIQAWVNANVHILDVVARLHPTPAVAGYPQAQACQLLAAQETWERSLYAAPLGWVNQAGEGEFIVGIRSALLSQNLARVYGGAGIVAGSEPEREWDEILLKLKTLLTTLA